MSEPVQVVDFAKAQMLSWFAILRAEGVSVRDLSVRLEDRSVWGSVWFLAAWERELLRIKQFAYDWGFSQGDPVNLSTGSWRADRTPTPFPVLDDFVGFYGVDYNGREAGSVVMYDTHIEIEVREGRLGPERMRQFMERLRPVDAEVAKWIASLPFALKSYHVRKKKPPWPSMPQLARMDWYIHRESVESRIGSTLPFEFDSVGPYSDPPTGAWELGGKLKGEIHAMFLFVRTSDEERIAELSMERIPNPGEVRGREPLLTHVEDLPGRSDLAIARYGELPPFGPGAAYLQSERGTTIVWFAPTRGYDRPARKRLSLKIYRKILLPSSN